MTKIDTRHWNLLDMLRRLGFTPDATPDNATGGDQDWFLIGNRWGGYVRVIIFTDGLAVEVHALDAHMVPEWSASYTAGTPFAVIRPTLRAAIGIAS